VKEHAMTDERGVACEMRGAESLLRVLRRHRAGEQAMYDEFVRRSSVCVARKEKWRSGDT
jgi:hypothetical protein